MNTFLRNTVLLVCVWMMLAGICMAREVHLQDGSIIDCESVWRRGDKVVVKINRDTMLEFRQEEVDLGRTFPKAKVKPRQTRKKKPVGTVRPHRAAKRPAKAASSPVQTAPKAAAPLPASKPQPAAQPLPASNPQPAASETGRQEPAQPASADPVSSPRQGGTGAE
jgi:hypothetical protein